MKYDNCWSVRTNAITKSFTSKYVAVRDESAEQNIDISGSKENYYKAISHASDDKNHQIMDQGLMRRMEDMVSLERVGAIHADEIENSELLSLCSKGGCGENGQLGGNGRKAKQII